MSITEEFRNHIKSFRQELDNASHRRGVFEDSPDDSLYDIARVIFHYVVVTGLLDKTPASPPELPKIAGDIRSLKLVARIIAGSPSFMAVDNPREMGDLDALEFKLGEMLEHLRSPQTRTAATARKHAALAPAKRPIARRKGTRRLQYSARDEKLYQRIGSSDLQRLSLAELWKGHRTTWKELNPGGSQGAFRASVYRIRHYHKT